MAAHPGSALAGAMLRSFPDGHKLTNLDFPQWLARRVFWGMGEYPLVVLVGVWGETRPWGLVLGAGLSFEIGVICSVPGWNVLVRAASRTVLGASFEPEIAQPAISGRLSPSFTAFNVLHPFAEGWSVRCWQWRAKSE